MKLDYQWFEDMEARIPKGEVRTRFAPSPTGYMHVGNLRTALYTYLIARHNQGKFILRIEDTDQGRLVEGATDVIYRTLAECGLDHDEGPDVGGPVAPYIQTERRDTLSASTPSCWWKRATPITASARRRSRRRHSGEFDRARRPLPRPEPGGGSGPGWTRASPTSSARRSPATGTTTFHDAVFGDITVENNDPGRPGAHQAGRPAHLQLRQRHRRPPDGHHPRGPGQRVPVLRPQVQPALSRPSAGRCPPTSTAPPSCGTPHNKMSKRHGDPSYEDLKAQGYLTQAILNYVALLGWSPRGELAEQEVFSLEELVEAFDLAGISKSPAIFDIEKLTHFNATVPARHGAGGLCPGGGALYPPER